MRTGIFGVGREQHPKADRLDIGGWLDGRVVEEQTTLRIQAPGCVSSLRAALGVESLASRCVSRDHYGAHPKRRANPTQAAPVLFPEGDLGFYVPSAP